MRIAILGGGLSGISLNDILFREYGIKADLYEKESRLGGLCRTDIIDNYVYDLSGGHVFNSKYQDVLDYVFNLLPKSEWEFSVRKSKINFRETIIDYPFEFSLSKLDNEIAADCIESLFNRNTSIKVESFKDILIKNFGQKIYDYYLGPYNEKIWKYSPEDMDYDWIDGKLPFPNAREILIKALNSDTRESEMSHSTYFYPKYGGIQKMVNKISESIDEHRRFSTVTKVNFIKDKVIINDEEYDLVINTIPLPELLRVMSSIDDNISSAIKDLKFNSVQSYLFSIDKTNDWSWLYNPNKNIIPHRIVYQGNFSNQNAPKGKSSITVEITKPELYSEEEILNNISETLGLTDPIAKNFTKYAYVVFDKKRKDNIALIKEYFKQNNIFLHGRFAEWEYPNMDICIKKSINLAKNIYQNLSQKNNHFILREKNEKR